MPSPTLRAFHAYVEGEIAALQGHTDVARSRYAEAIALARSCGSSFVGGIARVGLVSLQARTGRVADALRGYADLLDYWERTGGWVRQWTTLRSLVQLLDGLGDAATAAFLDAAADSAPDAPPAQQADPPGAAAGLPNSGSATRAAVLDVARRAITRHLAAARTPAPTRSALT